MRNVKTLSGELSGFTVGRRTVNKQVQVAILWDTDVLSWYSEAELSSLLV